MATLTQSPADLLMRQFLAWIEGGPRSYDQVMEGWRTSCPRLSIWEDAVQEGFVRLDGAGQAQGAMQVRLTTQGEDALRG
jgi:hypothetical protein